MIGLRLANQPRGVARVDYRRVLDGIFRVLRSGAPGRDPPERYGARHHLRQPLQPLAQGRGPGPADGGHRPGP